MIDLEPIPQKIQKRLFEKMRVLGRKKPKSPNTSKSKEVKYGLTHAKMATRSTFLRMTSGQLNPVILQGGKLADSNALGAQVPSGYDEIYGPRNYNVTDQKNVQYNTQIDTFVEEGIFNEGMAAQMYKKSSVKTQLGNTNKRPMPGITSMDASFKGGQRALREATISWICWDWEELNLLMPHFLAHGKTVMIEWGWVYDANSINKLFDFIETDSVGNLKISANAFTDYRDDIAEKEGDIDMMVGMIKNFEFTTREDGGFDCQTIISSVGASIMNTPQPNDAIIDPGITYNLSINQDSKEVAEAIEDATGEQQEYAAEEGTEQEALIELNTNATLKLFVKNIDKYILETIQQADTAKAPRTPAGATRSREMYSCIPNRFLLASNMKGRGTVKDLLNHPPEKISNCWVRWGWFEDNILSKFLSVTSNKTYDVLTEFRSVNKVAKSDDTPSGYESVRIKNNPNLETLNINRYILPGQFNPMDQRDVEVDLTFKTGLQKEKTTKIDILPLEGDKVHFHNLKTFINDNFDIFNAGELQTIIVGQKEKTITTRNGVDISDFDGDGIPNFSDVSPGVAPPFVYANIDKTIEVDITKKIPGKEGFLRNMLINTKVLRDAFGVSSGTMTAEPVNVLECIQSMFTMLNQDIDFWNFNLVIDDTEDKRVKIIDKQITAFNFNKAGGTLAQKSVDSGFGIKQQDGTGGPGVFYFPVWRKDSMVKRQNIVAKIPDELALTTMYGANMDQLKDFANPGSQFADKSGVAVAGLFNNQLDENKQQLDVAFKNNNTRRIGVDTQKPEINSPIQGAGDSGDDIEPFIKRNSKELEQAYEDRLSAINDSLKTSPLAGKSLPQYNTGTPIPMLSNLKDDEISKLLKFELDEESISDIQSGKLELPLGQLLSAKFYKTGEMKPPFKRTVGYLTTQHGIFKEANNPLLIPLELELEIDGIGGIYPGNSFHSTYIPSAYQSKTVFQAFDVNHRLDASGWTTTIAGKMRSTISNIFTGYKTLEDLKTEQFENYIKKSQVDALKRLKEDWRQKGLVAAAQLSGKKREARIKEYNGYYEAEASQFIIDTYDDVEN